MKTEAEMKTVHALIGRYAILGAEHGFESQEAIEFLEENNTCEELIETAPTVVFLWNLLRKHNVRPC